MKVFCRLTWSLLVILLPCSVQAGVTIGLVAHYELDGNAEDTSGFDNDGIVFGATPSTDRFGMSNGAYFFNGIDNYIEIPESSIFDSTAFSISVWFRAESFPAEAGFLISKGQNNFEIHTLSEVTGPSGMKFLPRFVAHGVITDWHSPPDSYSLGEWTHVVGVYDPGNNDIRYYVDGFEVPLIGPAATPTAPDNTLNARLGMRADNTLAFHGYLDDVRIYDRALSSTEVAEIHADVVPEASSVVIWGLVLCVFVAWNAIRGRRAVDPTS
jgi:concanavalin A-like lectin/glucanase superfamily protein